MQLFLSNIITFEEVQKIENINNELAYLLKDDYIFFYEEVYKMIYFCKKDIFEKMKILNEIKLNFPIYSEPFSLFHFSRFPREQKKFSSIFSINSIETKVCKDKKCFIDTVADKTKKFYINKRKFFVETNYKDLPYPKIMNLKTISKLLENTNSAEYDVIIKFLQATSGNILLFEELRKKETLMKFNLTYPINYLFKFKNKQDFFEDVLGESYSYNLDILKFDTAHELIQCTKNFLNRKDWGEFYYFSKNKFDKLKIDSPQRLRFVGMCLLHQYLADAQNIKDEVLIEDYITLLYIKKEKIDLLLKVVRS